MTDKEMLKQIREYKFAVNELALYLDTHPYDREALSLHRNYAEELEKLKKEYERMYGPLTIYCPANQREWKWVDEPWPWEGVRR